MLPSPAWHRRLETFGCVCVGCGDSVCVHISVLLHLSEQLPFLFPLTAPVDHAAMHGHWDTRKLLVDSRQCSTKDTSNILCQCGVHGESLMDVVKVHHEVQIINALVISQT